MMVAKNLIFYADDFGLLPQGDEAILELLTTGRLQGTSVLLAGLTDGELSRLQALKRSRDIRIGLHLDARKLLDQDGGIADEEKLGFILKSGWRLVFSRSLRDRVRVSWKNQIEQFISRFGYPPDQLEAHQHLNFHPFLFADICRLAQEFGIKHIRGGRRALPARYSLASPKAVMINALLGWDRFFTSGGHYGFDQKTTDSLLSIDWLFPKKEPAAVVKMLSEISERRVEVIFHPAKRLPGRPDYEILIERYRQYDFLKNL